MLNYIVFYVVEPDSEFCSTSSDKNMFFESSESHFKPTNTVFNQVIKSVLLRLVVAQGHKHTTVNTMVVELIPTRWNEIFNIFISFLW